ncbi:NAD(P)-binding protein [Mycena sanguinolenta]|uniref:NAD(P)-binding protein n=1 Tax=Mycena sanguinolenta TaxID=230812 RepID=A0A8H6ZF50_9AGAR|nr:NAD(P)-binding protein [Mycena sanguinolenta]
MFTPTTTADEVATTFAKEIQGKNVLITGTSMNGLGFETAQTIAKYANLVIITGHNTERLKLSTDALKREVPGANIRPLVLDLASLDAVRKAAAEVNAYPEHIDILINNAASPLCPFRLTVDGFEQQLATDHLGPFLFTALIVPKILAAQTSSYTPRVVYVSSGSHAWGSGVNLEELEHPNEATYTGMQAYTQAKSANILISQELTRRAGGRIHAYSLTPGAILTNFVQSESARDELLKHGIITEDGKPNLNAPFPWKTISQGAATILAAAFDPSLNEKPGCYLSHSVENNAAVAPHSSDPVMAGKLWELSERLVNAKFL